MNKRRRYKAKARRRARNQIRHQLNWVRRHWSLTDAELAAMLE